MQNVRHFNCGSTLYRREAVDCKRARGDAERRLQAAEKSLASTLDTQLRLGEVVRALAAGCHDPAEGNTIARRARDRSIASIESHCRLAGAVGDGGAAT